MGFDTSPRFWSISGELFYKLTGFMVRIICFYVIFVCNFFPLSSTCSWVVGRHTWLVTGPCNLISGPVEIFSFRPPFLTKPPVPGIQYPIPKIYMEKNSKSVNGWSGVGEDVDGVPFGSRWSRVGVSGSEV